MRLSGQTPDFSGKRHFLGKAHVGRYVIMPDHIHLFAAPTETDVDLDGWIRFWKSCFTKEIRRSKSFKCPPRFWQSQHWDTRLRNWRSYDNKWTYVRNNPVRHGLVTHGRLAVPGRNP